MKLDSIDIEKRPVVIAWEITQACDLECKHCRAEAQPQSHPNELSTKEAKMLLGQIAGFGSNQVLIFTGGDPLKREDVFELIRHSKKLGLLPTMTPSGTSSLTEEAIENLRKSGLRRIALSFDGASAASHDEFRGEEGSFEETLRAARNVNEHGIPLQINTTVCESTVDELSEVAELVEKLDAVLWSVFFLVPVGRGAVLEEISPSRAEEVMKWLSNLNKDSGFGVKTTEAPHYRRVSSQMNRSSSNPGKKDRIVRGKGVRAGAGFCFVSHVGEVYPSGFLPVSAGNVREESVVDIYRDSRLFNKLRDPESFKGKCGVCEFRQICGGSRSRAFSHTGDPLESDPLCAYIPEGFDGVIPWDRAQG